MKDCHNFLDETKFTDQAIEDFLRDQVLAFLFDTMIPSLESQILLEENLKKEEVAQKQVEE